MSRLRRIRRWWPAIPVLVAVLFIYAAWPGKSTFTVSKETTYITEPLDGEGFVNYPLALNERLSQGVTPANNANVLIVRALGPRPEGAPLLPEYYRWLGIDPLPEQGEYFISSDKYYEANLKESLDFPDDVLDLFEDDQTAKKSWTDKVELANRWPWNAKVQPVIADWLQQNEKPLALIFQASKRTHYYNPLVSRSSDPRSARLISSLLPTVQKCRAVGSALSCRAMMRVGDGNFDAAWQDLMTCQRIGRHIGSNGTLIESLVGIALVNIATNAQITMIGHGKHSGKQLLEWPDDLKQLPKMPPIADQLDLCERFSTLDALISIVANGPDTLQQLNGPVTPSQPRRTPFFERLFTRSIDFDPAFRHANETFDRCVAACRLPDRAMRKSEFAKIVSDLKQMKQDVDQAGVLKKSLMGKSQRGEMIGNILISLLLPAFEKLQDAGDRTEQQHANLQLAYVLAAYRADTGRYPSRLDEIAPKYLTKIPGDLFSGKPLIYKPTEDGYMLYSVGINELDEEGRSYDDEARGDDLRVRMPVVKPAK